MLPPVPDWKKLLDTAAEKAGEGLKVAGEGLRTATDEARKVAGINVGTITLKPSRTSYSLGDTIAGTVELNLTEPIPARRLVVALVATRKRMTAQRGSDGRVAPVQRTETLVDHQVDVEGEQSFVSGRHRFAIHIPDSIEAKVDVGGTLGDVLNAAQAVRSMTASPIRWKLRAYLDIPWKRNLSKAIDLSVRDV
ncbi:hypothetical protein PPSIR1_00867 [Plesiocystis pacifica SIR-1]|uniref:Uncharacterized protein n=1 Tax=Plesiocystis pacifica SIR-1 TaxID=391625 RepID=A6GCA7_9BACT|nr:hypothetical protein PPSIR1_00867 [Plesiocystis pacifica SIR-1]